MYRRMARAGMLIGSIALAGPALSSPTAPLPISAAPPVAAVPAPRPTSGAPLTAADIAKLSPSAQGALRDLADISVQVRNGQNEEAAARLRILLPTPGYAELPPQFAHLGFTLLANLDARAGRLDEALTVIQHATSSSGATAVDWQEQMLIALSRHDMALAAASLTVMAQKFPASLAGLQDGIVLGVYGGAGILPNAGETQFQLAQALIAANWRPTAPFNDASAFIVDQAARLIDRGDLAGARGIIGQVDEPAPMIGARADKRFAPLIATDPAAFDLEALGARRLARIDAAAAASPGLVAGVEVKASSLMAFGKFDEALHLLDDALAKAQPADGGPSSYVDAQGQLASIMALRARALAGLGRYDEALEQMNRAATRPEAGHINVTQRIALARLQIEMGKPKDALATLDALAPSDTTEAGRLQIESLRVCADAHLADKTAQQAAYDWVLAHKDLDPSSLVDAAACAGDMETASRALIGMLEDHERRLSTLAWTQDLRKPPPPPGPHPNVDDRREALIARPEVRAEINKVGRIDAVPLYRGFF